MASIYDPTTSTELHLSSPGPDPSSNKEHSHRCRSSQLISPSFAFLETTLSEQGCWKSILPSPNSACFPWEQSGHRKEAPTVAVARVTPACRRINRSGPIAAAVDSPHRKRLRSRKQASSKNPQRKLTRTQVLLLQSLWTPVELPHHSNNHTPWPQTCQATYVLCGQHASLQLPADQVRHLLEALQKRLQIDVSNPELAINPCQPCWPKI